MKLQLQRLRKLAGYKTQKAVADALGVPERRYASWEREEAMMSLEQAAECAVLFNCTIDAIAGLEQPVTYSDPEQSALNGYYQSMNDEGRAALVSTAKLMSGSPDTRIEKDRPAPHGVPAEMGGVA